MGSIVALQYILFVTGTVLSVQLWAKATELLSRTNKGIKMHILNAVASDKSPLDLDNISYRKLVEIGFDNNNI